MVPGTVQDENTEREAIATAVDNARWVVATASLLGAVAGGLLATFAVFSDRLSGLALAIGIPITLMYLLATPAYLRWSIDAVLQLLHAVILLTALAYLVLLADALFGDRSALILAEELPLVLVYLPVQLIFLCTYLPKRHAFWYVGVQAAITLLMLMLYLVLHPAALRSAAWYWILGSVLIATPICLQLVQLQAALHGERRRALARSEASLTGENAELQATEATDPLAGCMNQTGLRRSLTQAVVDQPETRIALLEIERYEPLRLQLGRQRTRQLIGRLANAFREAFGDSVRWGRWRPGQLVLWAPAMSAELVATNLAYLQDLLRKPEDDSGPTLDFRLGQAATQRVAPHQADATVEALILNAEYDAWPERRLLAEQAT